MRTDWLVVRGTAGFTLSGGWDKALRCLLVRYAESVNETGFLRSVIGGNGFERHYIRGRFDRKLIQPQRYTVHDGFQKHHVQGQPPSDCDVEYIVRDGVLNHHYFIQAKHAARGEIGYLDSLVATLRGDLGKGMRQLRGARACLENGQLQSLWASRGLSEVTAANSSFLLVHNIAHLDLQMTQDGIALYDWRTLRNLLDDGSATAMRSGGGEVTMHFDSPGIVADPVQIVKKLMSEHVIYANAAEAAWAATSVSTSMELVGGTVHITALGL